MSQAAEMIVPQDGLGSVSADVIQRYDPRDLARTLGGYREAWGDLGALVQDLDAVGMISDGSAHPWAPMVLHRLGHHLQHGHHTHHGHMGTVVHKLLAHLHAVMARHVDLEREKKLWHAKSNVVQTMYWQGVAANTASTTATMRAPYSGVNYMILDCLMPANLTPFGFWTNISFASINFAQSGQTIAYAAPGASGTQGAFAGGMGFTAFYEDKTAPEGCRGWNPWTGWILSSDAVSTWQWFNGSTANPASVICDVLMRSSPCDTADWGQAQGGIGWSGFYAPQHPLGSHALDLMYAGVLGLSGALKGPPQNWLHGQHQGHPGSYGSVGPGYGAHPSGHAGPWGPALPGGGAPGGHHLT
jgi:hypothetical protein